MDFYYQGFRAVIYLILFQLITISLKLNKSLDLDFNIQSGISREKLYQLFQVKEESEEDLSILLSLPIFSLEEEAIR